MTETAGTNSQGALESDVDTLKERIEAAKDAKSTTPNHERTRCPGCLSVSIRDRVGDKDHNRRRNPDAAYYCPRCDASFDDVLEPYDDAYPTPEECDKIDLGRADEVRRSRGDA